jgi:hypothetical protein
MSDMTGRSVVDRVLAAAGEWLSTAPEGGGELGAALRPALDQLRVARRANDPSRLREAAVRSSAAVPVGTEAFPLAAYELARAVEDLRRVLYVRPTMLRPTATVRDTADQPLDRTAYAVYLRERVAGALDRDAEDGRSAGEARVPLLSEPEAAVVAALLEELAGVYPCEELGRLAREFAVRLYDRLRER